MLSFSSACAPRLLQRCAVNATAASSLFLRHASVATTQTTITAPRRPPCVALSMPIAAPRVTCQNVAVPGRYMMPNFKQVRFATSSSKPLFEKILIANRGEIACRVIKTCKKMGIKTVAVYSEPDRNSKHVKMADEAVHIGPALSAESYLNMNKILDACKKTGAKAVHPGYGFLSENAKFCELLESNGIVFIGPKVNALSRMGKKIESKKIARSAGVSTIPGFAGPITGTDHLLQIANEIGYPVMVKASGGGGGKGMRIAWNDQEALDGYRLSKEEARKSFGDDTMLVEKFIENPRHIEIQLLMDSFGNGVYLNERECSIQRRNQKVVEEAPSTFIDPATRKAMGEQAIALGKAVGYQCAGTVEMLVDKHRNFYFLEMNTRLQVEHPITEMTTGIDLVEHMIRVSAGEKLAFTQDQIPLRGWAFETRVYAEDPLRGFLPSIGRLTKYQEPAYLDPENIRCDSGILEGAEISMHYDPMICKLITYGKDRNEALAKMRVALDSYVIRGVNHNICFLRAILDHPRFIKGDISTKFIPEEWPSGFKSVSLSEKDTNALVAGSVAVHAAHIDRQLSIEPTLESFDAERIKAKKMKELIVNANDKEFRVTVDTDEMSGSFYGGDASFKMSFNGQSYEVECSYQQGDALCNISVNGEPYVLQVIDAGAYSYKIQHFGTEFPVKIRTPRENELLGHMPLVEQTDYSRVIMSPMPGAVISINVKPGDTVIPGQEVCVIEAMKMQNVLRAERDGVIKSVQVKVGDTVGADDVLVNFK